MFISEKIRKINNMDEVEQDVSGFIPVYGVAQVRSKPGFLCPVANYEFFLRFLGSWQWFWLAYGLATIWVDLPGKVSLTRNSIGILS